MPLIFIGPAIRLVKEFGPRIARGFAEYEKPLFRWAYQGNRLGRIGKPIYRGYKAGTIIGLAGDAVLDALLQESYVDTPRSQSKARGNMDFSSSKRFRSPNYRSNRCYRKPYNSKQRRYRQYS